MSNLPAHAEADNGNGFIAPAASLLDACVNSDIAGIDAAVASGEDVAFAWDGGITALHIVALRGDVECVDALLGHGALVNTQTRNGETPAYFATSTGDKLMVSHLARQGADFSLATKLGITPLHLAFAQKNFDLVALLLWLGGDPLCFDAHKRMPDQMVSRDEIPANVCQLLRVAIQRRITKSETPD